METASWQPVFHSPSFMRWRRECMVSFLSVITVLRRFIIMAEAASLPREGAYFGKIASPSTLSCLCPCNTSAALRLRGIVLCDPLVLRPLIPLGRIVIERSFRSTSQTSSSTISESLAPVSVRVTNSAQASGSSW